MPTATEVIHARCGFCHRLLERPANLVSFREGYGWAFCTLACRNAWFSAWMNR